MLNLPNAITLIRIALVVVFTIAVTLTPDEKWGYVIALISFILAAFSDWLDGYLARKLGEVTTFGKLIDPLADKIAVSAAFIYLTSIDWCPAWVTILIITREFLVTGIRQIAQEHRVIIAADKSGKWKTAFQLAFCLASLFALVVKEAYPESLAALAPLAEFCCAHPNVAIVPWIYHITLWTSVILTLWSGIFYCLMAREFLFQEQSSGR